MFLQTIQQPQTPHFFSFCFSLLFLMLETSPMVTLNFPYDKSIALCLLLSIFWYNTAHLYPQLWLWMFNLTLEVSFLWRCISLTRELVIYFRLTWWRYFNMYEPWYQRSDSTITHDSWCIYLHNRSKISLEHRFRF